MPYSRFFARHSEFIGHIATLMSGKSVAAAIALFTTPIVARLFDPGDFGVAAVFVSIVSLVTNISSLRYEAALSLPKRDEEARTLMALAYWILFSVFLVSTTIVVIVQTTGVSFPTLDLLGIWAWLVPVGVLLIGTLQVQDCWLTRKKLFRISAVSLVAGNSVTAGSRIAFGAVTGTTVYGLVIGYLLGTLTRLIIQKSASRESLQVAFKGVDWPAMRSMARSYSDFPRLNAPAGLVFALGNQLPVLLFGVMFSPVAAGLYAMSNRLAKVPTTLLSSSIRRVFLQKAASIRNRGGSLLKGYLLATAGLVLVGFAPLIVVMMYGQPMMGWLLGERWVEAGRYLEIIAPWMFIMLVTAPANPVFIVLRRQKFWLTLQTTITVLRLGVFGMAYYLAAGPEWTLQAFVTATVAANLLTIAIALWLILRQSRDDETGSAAGPLTLLQNDVDP